MLKELKQPYAVLDVRTSPEVAVKKANMEPLLNQLFLQQPSKLEGKESETGMASGSKSDAECSDSDEGNPSASSA
ncbi:hypothetical protein Dsin_009778 [Dipteronia sinensis]|uniref:Uncharacterized protein n=1 Tax=Dipteronia sinensis TaxID=43782 RepID=A0AAE0ARM3_9ROSI|nr:hypothetical protein Dsin_009778 [Dipteronia sinensis]